MGIHLGGMSPYPLSLAPSSSATASNGVDATRFGPKAAAVSAAPFREAAVGAKNTVMAFLALHGDPGDYSMLTSLIGT